MENFEAEGSTFIDRPVEEVFDFICNPDVDPAELTPMEDRVTDWQELGGVGAFYRATIELAARELDCVVHCVEHERPRKLTTHMEGDLESRQRWQLAPENGGTRLSLDIELERPHWVPPYLREERAARNWAQMLVEQTLALVRGAMQGERHAAG